MRFVVLSTTLLLLVAHTFADPIIVSRQLKWNDKPTTLYYPGNKEVKAMNFFGANYSFANGSIPYYYENFRFNENGKVTAQITNAVYEPIVDQSLLTTGVNLIGSSITVKAEVHFKRAKPYACLSFFPFRKNEATGKIERLKSFNIEIIVIPNSSQQTISSRTGTRSLTWAANSVLASGTWYEFGVNGDGVYKLDKNFFQSIGINIANINPQNIRIFGNGGGMLPENNSSFRYDDLQENAVYFSGGSNTTFGSNDYFLVYCQNPNRWYYNSTSKTFYHQVHLYSDYTYYYITTDYSTSNKPKRIPSYYYPGTANQTVTSFNDYQFVEPDSLNMIESGRMWLGQPFEYNLSRSYQLNFPNIMSSSPATLVSSVWARSIGSVNSSFNIAVNGSSVLLQSIGPVTGNFEDSFAATSGTNTTTFTPSSSTLSVNITYNQNSSADIGWLYYLELNVRRALTMSGSQMSFRDATSFGTGNVAQYDLATSNSNITIWDVTDPINIVKDSTQFVSGNTLQFKAPADSLRQFIAFDGQTFYTPALIVGQVANQNLHALSATDLVIVAAPQFMSAANSLAAYHQSHDNISAQVVNENLIFNEFSSGAPDIVAVRDLMKMFFDRAGGDSTKMPKYLLLFGDGSYDYKNRVPNNTNYVLAYETPNSYDPIDAYTSDDFYGFLEDADSLFIGSNSYLLDIAVGRITADNTQQASDEVNKIIQYSTSQDFGSWRNTLTFLTDASVDANQFEQASEGITNDNLYNIATNYPVYNVNKIYLDAYPVATAPGGQSYPGANTAFYNQIYSGSLIVDYNGHGSAIQLSAADVLTISDINNWTNLNKLPLFVTATCQFTQFDNPAQQSAGELMLLKNNGGAIALVSTVRLVYLDQNTVLNDAFNQYIYQPVNGQMPRLGDAFLNAKNQVADEQENSRKFSIFGDPALRLAYPEFNVQTTAINNKAITSTPDTLKALGKVTISGIVTDRNGNKLTNFNGIVYPTVYDKPVAYSTLGSNGVQTINFKIQNSIIYKGAASVHNGAFTFTFVVPKDIAYQYGFAKISYYADDAQNDANGYFSHIIVGGLADTFALDRSGPGMKLYMNNTQFVFGGVTDANPKLLVLLSDSFGINITSNGIGHNITAVMDNNTQNTTDLNSFYQADLDNYQKGTVLYPYTDLADGLHSINVTAWDVYDKSSQGYIEFIVASSAQMALDHVLNYPNPFTTHTTFMFDDNMPGQLLHVQIQIYTISGKLVKTITTDESSDGYHVGNISWNGLDDYGSPIGRGVYIYRIFVTTAGGLSANKFEKLVVLR